METFLKNLILWLSLSWVLAASAQAQSFQPLIPMSYSSQEIPLVEVAVRDPEIVKRLISDDLYFEQSFEELKASQAELQNVQGPRRLEILESLYIGFANISYFLEDVRSGRVNVQANYHPIEPKLANTRRMAMTYANQFAQASNNPSKKATALYHVYVIQYLMGDNQRAAVRSLARINGQLNPFLQRRARLLAGLDDIAFGNRERGKQTLGQIIGGLPVSGGIAARLAIARNDAGLNSQGRKVRQTQASYRGILNQAMQRGQGMSRQDRERMLSFAVAVWRAAEGQNASWERPPFPIQIYADLDLSKAMSERTALTALNARRYDQAISRYEALSQQFLGLPMMARIDERVLSIHKIVAQQSNQPVRYQNALLSYEQKYSEQARNFNPQVAEQMRQKLSQEHRSIVQQTLQRASQPNQGVALRNQALQMAERFLNGREQSADFVPVRTQVARIHVLSGNHQAAVAVYMDLKNRTQGGESLNFLNLAIVSQSALASWPAQAPWAGGVRQGNAAARGQLATMYTEKFQRTGSWDDVAHLGLIWIQLGQAPQAYRVWTEQLQKQASGPHAQRAAGQMLLAFQGGKQWQAMEDLARLAINSRLTPISGNRQLNPVEFLGESLFEGGKQLFAQQQWAESVKKLNEFVASYRRDQRRPEAMFILAQGHHNNASYPLAIETMLKLVNEYPTSRFIRDALVLGGQWSVPMAYEEQTIYFYQMFVERFTDDPRTPGIRETLLNLYMGRDLYGHAARLHQAIATDRRSNRQLQVRSALAVMDIEERYGEARYAQWGAKHLREIAGNDQQVMARVLGFETRTAARQNNMAQIERLERQLRGMSTQYPEVVEALAQARFIIAESRSDITKQEFFNIGLKNPTETLKRQFAIFRSVEKLYESVCSPGISSYCAPAMVRLSEMTRNTLNSIEDISIAQTLDDKTVNQFEELKLGIIVYLADQASKADDRALGIVEEGQSTPTWSREVMWLNSNDWTFEEGNPTSGNGYVQWAPVVVSSDSQDR